MIRIFRLACIGCLALALVACEAQKQIDLARAAALSGRPAEAERHYRLALEANPKLADDPEFAAALRRAKAQSLHEDAKRLESQHNWSAAMDQYRAAIAVDGEYEPAREALAAAGPKAAAWYVAQAADMESKNRLDEAIAHLKQAVSYQPDHPVASRELTRVIELRRERMEKAGNLIADSRRLAGEKQWDAAIAAALSATKLVPNDPSYPKQADAVRQAAAQDYTALGQNLLDAGKLEDAERQFNLAMKYVANYPNALRGLGDADFQRGQAAQQKNLFGRAMLWYRRAAGHIADKRYSAGIAAAKARLLHDHSVDVKIRGGSEDQSLVSRVVADFQHKRPSYVRLIDATNQAPADYVFDIDLARLDIRAQVQSSRKAAHRYKEEFDIPNPRLPQLRGELLNAQRDLERLEHRRDEHCPKCDGRGWVKCNDCNDHKKKCSSCRGTGRRYSVSDFEIRNLEDKVHDLRHQLVTEPAMARQVVDKEWPYTIITHAKVGDLEAVIALSDVNAGVMLDTQLVRRHYAAEDATISGANPAIGLAEDPLTLPDDSTVTADLLAGGTGEVTQRLTLMIARQRYAAVEAVAAKATGDAAVELRVTAALLLEPAEPTRAAQLLNRIP